MKIRSLRRITDDARHNAFTGACWFQGNLYIAYRQGDAHVCAFGRIVVLRSRDGGVSWDHVAVIRGPGDTRDAHRFALSFYSDGVAPTDLRVSQWDHPDIYWADVLFEAEYLTDGFKVSKRVELPHGLADAKAPNPNDKSLEFRPMKTDSKGGGTNFLDVSSVTDSKPDVVYIVRDIEVGPVDTVRLHLGYDGPVKVWWNGEEVFAGHGTNPAIKDQTSLRLESKHGMNRLAIALDTNNGKAQGIFARWDPA